MRLSERFTRYKPTLFKLVKYLIVGGSVNAFLYGVYLLLSMAFDVSPLIATTITYVLGVALTYIGNTFWSFEHGQSHTYSLPRYIAAYGVGYVVQAGVLIGAVSAFGIMHQIAQLAAMVVAAGAIFMLLNYWVYKD